MYVKINGFGINYSVEGPRSGLPIVLIHGFPFSKEMWKPQVDVLKKECYVITYDVRGHGASDMGSGQYTVEFFVDDLIGLLNHLKISKTIVAGLSMGGYIALRAVERNPDRFQALILCDTRSEGDSNETKIRRATQANEVKTYGMNKFADTFLKTVFCENTFKNNPDVVKLIKSIIEKTSISTIAGTLIALSARTDTTSSLYNINVPTLILVGKFDELTPPSASNAMKEKIPNAEMHIISNAAHLSNLENPDEFNKHLLNFLRTIE